MNKDMETIFLNNSIQQYLIALGAFILSWLVLKFLQSFVLKKLEKFSKRTKTDLDDTFIKIFKSIKPPFYNFLSFYLALFFLELSPSFRKWLGLFLLAWFVYQIILAVQVLIDFLIEKKLKGEKKETESVFRFLGTLLKWLLWIVGGILILSNLGFNVSSLIAGLGIGGLAVAMAVKGLLEDLFSSFSIYFDKPFVVGDNIKVDKNSGKVLKIGIKSTRLRSSEGETLIISNKELTSARIRNFGVGKLEERKVKLTFGLVYTTPNEKLKKVPQILREIIDSLEKTKFVRAHFTAFGDSSLNFEVLYKVLSHKYTEYLDAQEEINLKLKEVFEKEKIEMAYPTQTVFLSK